MLHEHLKVKEQYQRDIRVHLGMFGVKGDSGILRTRSSCGMPVI
jgi:hypothetical protein